MKKYHLPLAIALAEMATYLYAVVKAIADENLLEWSVSSKNTKGMKKNGQKKVKMKKEPDRGRVKIEGLKVMRAYNCLFNKMNDKLNQLNNQQVQWNSFISFASPIDR